MRGKKMRRKVGGKVGDKRRGETRKRKREERRTVIGEEVRRGGKGNQRNMRKG